MCKDEIIPKRVQPDLYELMLREYVSLCIKILEQHKINEEIVDRCIKKFLK